MWFFISVLGAAMSWHTLLLEADPFLAAMSASSFPGQYWGEFLGTCALTHCRLTDVRELNSLRISLVLSTVRLLMTLESRAFSADSLSTWKWTGRSVIFRSSSSSLVIQIALNSLWKTVHLLSLSLRHTNSVLSSSRNAPAPDLPARREPSVYAAVPSLVGGLFRAVVTEYFLSQFGVGGMTSSSSSKGGRERRMYSRWPNLPIRS